MGTIQEEIDLAFVEIGSQFKSLRGLTGALAGLSTNDKTNLVNAINEVAARVSTAGAQINDTTPATTSVYSSSRVANLINEAKAAVKTDILGGADSTVDTLKEIADKLIASDTEDDNAIAALVTAVGNRIRFDAAQTLSAAQKIQANDNIGSLSLAKFGDPVHSYRSVFLTSLQ